MGGPKRGPAGECRADCAYRAGRGWPWTCDYAGVTGKTRLAACRRLGVDTDVGVCPVFRPRGRRLARLSGALALVLAMTAAVCLSTAICGETDCHAAALLAMTGEGETDCHGPAALAMTGEEETDCHAAALLGMTEDGGTGGVIYRADLPLGAEEQGALAEACREFGVPYELALAVIWQETDYRNVVGDGGDSLGYMQLQRRWVWPEMEELGAVDLMDPVDNFRVGCCLLARYINEDGIEGGLTRYNTGSPGWSEYAESIMEKWTALRSWA